MKDHEYFVYIMASRSGTLYTGMTNSICRRALQHKKGEIDGFAKKYGCTRLAHYESFETSIMRSEEKKKSRVGHEQRRSP